MDIRTFLQRSAAGRHEAELAGGRARR
jgi:hypothetical protein